MANAKRLQKVLDYITENPLEHDQYVYARRTHCGTTMCFAGHGAVQAGHKLQFSIGGDAYYTDQGHIAVAAARWFEITDFEAGLLFDPLNSLDDLWRLAGKMTNGLIQKD